MREIHFDTQGGNVYAASAAGRLQLYDVRTQYYDRMLRLDEQASVEPHLIPLMDLVDAPRLPEDIGPYQKLEVDDWERDNYIRYGKWVLRMVNNHNTTPHGDTTPPRPITWVHARNLHRLGIGPDTGHIKQHFLTLTGFKRAIGARITHDRITYAHWTTEDYIAYAQRLEAKLGRQPRHNDYTAAARNGEGPSYRHICSQVDSVSSLNELLGRTPVKRWRPEDFITWGVRVMQQNPALPFTRELCETVSAHTGGPGTTTAQHKFKSWGAYKQEVANEYHRQEALRQAKITSYRNLIAKGALPAEYATASDDELLAIGGKYRVIQCCLPHANAERVARILGERKQSFTYTLYRASKKSAGYIESEAWVAGVYEDIWPSDDDAGLHISVEDFEAARVARNAYRRTQRELHP